MISILAAPTAAAASQELTSAPHLVDLVEDALAAYTAWDAASNALNATTGPADEVEAARLANRAAYHHYNRQIDALAEATDGKIAVDPAICYLHQSDAAWEAALNAPEETNGLLV